MFLDLKNILLLIGIIEEYIITWKGCIELNRCYVCKKSIKFSEKNFVMQSITDGNQNFAPLIHVKCMRKRADTKFTIPPEAICHHCGLPLSTKLLKSWYNQGSEGFDIVYNLLTKDEMWRFEASRDLICCWFELKKEFWGIEFTSKAEIEGSWTDSSIDVKITRDLAKEL